MEWSKYGVVATVGFLFCLLSLFWKQLYCIGEQSCLNTVISKVAEIVANGYNALSNSYIYSDIDGELDFKIYINGTNDYRFDIWCNETDTCKIDCQSTNACSRLYLHCYGECFVSCDDTQGIDCPLLTEGSFMQWRTESPTTMPTNMPSTIPTRIPTQIPSKIPTVPSNLPTNMPSTNPSTRPTT